MYRKPFILLLLCLTTVVYPFIAKAQDISSTRVTVHFKDASLKEIIQHIEKTTSFKFLAKAEDVESEQHITIDVVNQPLDVFLKKLLENRKLQYQKIDNNIIIKRISKGKDGSQTSGNLSKSTLSGTVKVQQTGEVLISASITVLESSFVTASNEYGFYSLTLPKGSYTILVSAAGMKARKQKVALDGDKKINFLLEEEVTSLEEVTVTTSGPSRSLKNPQMGIERINVQEIKNVPMLFGERDVLKAMQLLPGVKSAGEGNSGFYVRGGAADQNLILLDEAPVYNASHLLGFFSTFNSDAIKNVTLYKGAMPAQYGGRLSSVVDIKMNDGNNQNFGVSGGIGLIASRINVEGPIQKDKSSFLLSGRRTYADIFIKLLGDSSFRNARLYFYDLNAKTSIIISDKDRLFLSGYFGKDVLSQEDIAGINWGNSTGTLRWNHIFSKNLFNNTSLIFSNYDYKILITGESTNYDILSRIRDWNLKNELQWYLNAQHTLMMGANVIHHTIKPGEITVSGSSNKSSQGQPDRYALDYALYASDSWRLNEKWSLTTGMRLSAFTILGKGDFYTLNDEGKVVDTLHYEEGEVVKTYLNAEPRLSAAYQLNTTSSVKLSYVSNTQNLHLISNSTASSPTDKWIASTNIIKPEIADQVAVGYYKNFGGNRYEVNVEAYYKALQNQIDYRNGAQVFTNDAIETQLLFGKGRAYGMEWLVKKRAGRLNGWFSYTLSKTERKIDGINNSKWYNARQDRTHDIAIVAMYQLNKKWSLSANWVYYTGDAITYPSGKYRIDNEVYFSYSERNGYRMPDYHRLDLGATKQLKKGKRFSSELTFSVFNAYGRANAYQIDFQESEIDPAKTEAVKTSLFTFVPSITYNFKF